MGAAGTVMRRKLQWFWCWLVYRVVLLLPWGVCERLVLRLLPTAGEYAYAEDFAWFCANRDRQALKDSNNAE